jgi:hypothetical protein
MEGSVMDALLSSRLALALLVVAGARVATTALTYWTLRLPADPTIERVGLLGLSTPKDISDHFNAIEKMLVSRAFVPVDDIIVSPNVVTTGASRYAQMRRCFVERQHRELAVVYSSVERSGLTECQQYDQHVEFVTCYADGTAIATSNSLVIDIFPTLPGLTHYQLVGVASPVAVHKVHRAIVERRRTQALMEPRLIAEFGGDAVGYFQWFKATFYKLAGDGQKKAVRRRKSRRVAGDGDHPKAVMKPGRTIIRLAGRVANARKRMAGLAELIETAKEVR